jgi:hypothetical protein
MQRWQAAGFGTAIYELLNVDGFARAIADGRTTEVLDVRSPAEWTSGSVPGALWRYVPDLMAGVPAGLDPGSALCGYCAPAASAPQHRRRSCSPTAPRPRCCSACGNPRSRRHRQSKGEVDGPPTALAVAERASIGSCTERLQALRRPGERPVRVNLLLATGPSRCRPCARGEAGSE